MSFINKYETTDSFNTAVNGELSQLKHFVAYDSESKKVRLKKRPSYHVLTYKTTTENETINLFKDQSTMDKVVNDCIDVENGEKNNKLSTHL